MVKHYFHCEDPSISPCILVSVFYKDQFFVKILIFNLAEYQSWTGEHRNAPSGAPEKLPQFEPRRYCSRRFVRSWHSTACAGTSKFGMLTVTIVMIFDIRYRPRTSISYRVGAVDHSYRLTVLS